MANLTRYLAKIFGGSAGVNEIGVFGSFAAGSPAYATDPANAQSLSNWDGGWFDAVQGNNSPAIEDMNSYFWVTSYQLAYLMQKGIPEWNSATTYYQTSFVQVAGVIYKSKIDNNLNHAVTDNVNWSRVSAGSEKYTSNTDWVCPSGVSMVSLTAIRRDSVRIMGRREPWPSDIGFIDSYGNAFSPGNNNSGQVGDGTVTTRSSPVQVVGGLKFVKFYNTPSSRFGIDSTGNLYAWGFNFGGSLGVGDNNPRSSPTLIPGGLKFANTFVGSAVTESGQLYSWGGNSNGELGDNSVVSKSSPVAVVGGLKINNKLFGPQYAVSTAGVLYRWGNNANGQIGDGTVVAKSSPVAVVGGLTFKKCLPLASANGFYASIADGTLYAWGANTNGQLGIGNNIPRSSPTAVVGGLKFSSFTSTHTNPDPSMVALTSDGTAYTWGCNTKGQLGDGTTVDKSSPVLVAGGLKFKEVWGGTTNINSAQGYFLGLAFDGTLYAWGDNSQGCLGVGDNTARSSPVLVVGGLKFSLITGNLGGVPRGISNEGILYSWGNNFAGDCGVGDLVSRSSPTAVVGAYQPGGSDTVVTMKIPVTAGLTYPLKMEQFNAAFGSNLIGPGQFDEIYLEYNS